MSPGAGHSRTSAASPSDAPGRSSLQGAHRRRDHKVTRLGLERQELRQQAEDALGVFRPLAGNAVAEALERDTREAAVPGVGINRKQPRILVLLQSAVHEDALSCAGRQDAPEELI